LKAPNQNIKNQEYLSLVDSRLGEELEDKGLKITKGNQNT
jgi:hypothetical protein